MRTFKLIGLIAACAASVAGLNMSTARATPTASGVINVTVYRDFNANGVRDLTGSTEPGLQATKITAVCVTDTGPDLTIGTSDDLQATVTGLTNPSGVVAIPVPGSPCRLVASIDPSMESNLAGVLRPGAAAAGGTGTLVQFAKAGDSVRFGANVPHDYCQAVASVAMTCFTGGDNVTGPNNTNQNLHVFAEDQNTTIALVANGRANAKQIGSAYGLAYQQSSKTVFAAAFAKMGSSHGPNGAFAIYKVDPATANSGSLFVDLNAIGAGGTPDTRTGPGWTTAGLSGKIGLGGLAVGDDDSTLWAVNLEKATLIKMAIGSGVVPTVPSAASSVTIPSAQCTSAMGASRPFSVTAKDGAIWVGGVCEGLLGANTSLDTAPSAWVLKFDPTTPAWSTAIIYSLGYSRASQSNWTAWGRFAEPMLTGLAFVNNDLVMGFRLRESGPAGEMLRACTNDRVTWTLESATSCTGAYGSFSRTGPDVNSGPGGREFYVGDGIAVHPEANAGDLAQVQGHLNMQTSMNDPTTVNQGGFASLNDLTGARSSSAEVYNGSSIGRFGKSNGMGGIEMLCDQAPIEIGNRVWRDVDGDGQQDPGEPGINAVTVRLFDGANVLVGSTVTAGDGNYIFGGAANVNMLAGQAVKPNSGYYVRLDNSADWTALLANGLTATATGASITDSDGFMQTNPVGSPAGNWAIAKVTTAGPGSNDHTIDFGFKAGPTTTTTTTSTTTTSTTSTTTSSTTATTTIFVPPTGGTAPPVTITVPPTTPPTLPPVVTTLKPIDPPPVTTPPQVVSNPDLPFVVISGKDLPFTG